MNLFFRRSLFLAIMAVSIISPAYAEDLFDDSFFADPAPVDAVKPAEPAPVPAPDAPVDAVPLPADLPAPTEQPDIANTDAVPPAPEPSQSADASLSPDAIPQPEIPQPSSDLSLDMDFSMPASDLNVPAPSDVPPPSSAFGFNAGGNDKNQMSLNVPPSEQVLGKIPTDVFREMAEIERENNALMLQLKRDQLRSEIDALKTNSRQMLFDEIERREKMTQARLEWELAQDLKRQEALERRQKAEIRQKQIEAALKREEDRRIQKMKDEEAARIKKLKDEEEARIRKEKKEEEEAKRKQEELKKRYDAATMIQVKQLMPALIAATRPAKIKRYASSRVASTLTSIGEDMLAKRKANEALVTEVPAEIIKAETKETEKEEVVREPASSLYAVAEIRGTGGILIAKLIGKKEKSTFFVKKSSFLPTGHTVVNIDKDYVIVQYGKDKEIIGFPSAGLIAEAEPAPRQSSAPPKKKEKKSATAGLAPKSRPVASLSAVSMAK